MRKVLLAIAATLFHLMSPVDGHAAPYVAFQFAGTVFESSGNWTANGVNVGDAVTGMFSYDLATPDASPDDEQSGVYPMDEPGLFSVSVDGFQFDAGTVQVFVWNDLGSDRFLYNVVVPVSSGAITLSSAFLILQDNASAALVDDGLLATLDLSDWEIARVWLGADPAGGSALGIEITTLAQVPEPATVGLLAAALVAMAVMRRGQRNGSDGAPGGRVPLPARSA